MTDEQDNQNTAVVTEQVFLFNDYFSDPKDKGIEIVVDFGDKHIPFRIKRALNLKEREKAQAAAVKVDFDVKGRPSVSRLDQPAYTAGIVLAALLWWPFTYPADYENEKLAGKPVPITKDTVDALDGTLSSEIANRVLRISKEQMAALGPFEKRLNGA